MVAARTWLEAYINAFAGKRLFGTPLKRSDLVSGRNLVEVARVKVLVVVARVSVVMPTAVEASPVIQLYHPVGAVAFATNLVVEF